MNYLKNLFILVFLLASIPVIYGQPALSAKEMLRYGLTFADDDSSSQKVETDALANPDLLEEIVFLSKTEAGNLNNRIARQNAFTYLKLCSYQNRIPVDHFFEIAFKLLNNLSTYALASDLTDETNRYRSQVVNYGYNPVRKKFSVDLLFNFQALLSALDNMFKYGQLNNEGVLKSLKAKISGAKEILEKQKEKGKNPAINKIEAAISEIEAQKDKHLSEDGYLILKGFCNNLISQTKEKVF